jgi:hypothetical protein
MVKRLAQRFRQQARRLLALAMIGVAQMQRPLGHAVKAGDNGIGFEIKLCQLRIQRCGQRRYIARVVMIGRQ